MASEETKTLLRGHIQSQKAQRERETEVTTKLSALNAKLIFVNASQRSSEKADAIIEELSDELFGRPGERTGQWTGASSGGTVAPADSAANAPGGA